MKRTKRHTLTALACVFGTASLASAGTIVVLNKSEASASLIDEDSTRVLATLPTGEGPHEVAVSPDGRRAVVSNYGTSEMSGSSLTVIDVPGATVEKTIPLGAYRRPHGIAWLSDGRHVVVTAEANKSLLKVDVEEAEVVRAIPTYQEISHMVVVAPDDRTAFVSNIGSGTVTVIDLAGSRKLRDIATGEGAEGIAMTPDGARVWVTNRAADTLSIIDTETLELTESVRCAAFPIRVKVTPDGRYALVSNAESGDIAVFDAESHRELRRIAMPDQPVVGADRAQDPFGGSPAPVGILIHPQSGRAYVALTAADVVTILDLTAWTASGNLIAGKEPDGLGYSPLGVEAVPEETPRPGSARGGSHQRPSPTKTNPAQ